jgi:hypothetical protein
VQYHGKTFGAMNIHFNNERTIKHVLSRGATGRGRVKREYKGKEIWLMYFIYLYENRTMNPGEIILSSGEGSDVSNIVSI